MTDRLRVRDSPVTWSVTLVCSLAFAGCWLASAARAPDPGISLLRGFIGLEDLQVLRWFGAMEMTRVWRQGEWWRVGLTGLLHGSVLHVVLNMVGMVSLGRWLERAIGGWRFGLLFGVSSVFGCLASLAWAESAVVVGASAGIFGMAGALIYWRTLGPEAWRKQLMPINARRLGFFVAFWLAIGFLWPSLGSGRAILAQAGHVGGLIGGVLTALALDNRPIRAWIGRSAGVSLLAGLIWVGRAPDTRPNYHGLMGGAALEDGDLEEALEHFDAALEQTPQDATLQNAVAYALAEAGVELDRAEALSRQSLESEPDSFDYLDTLGWILCRKGEMERGLDVLEQAIGEGGAGVPEIEAHLVDCAEAQR